MSESENLLITLEDGIKRITINRPERRNAVDTETIQQLLGAVRESERDGSRVMILTGAGESFCAGADLQVTDPSGFGDRDVTTALREGINPIIKGLRDLPLPVIARVHGHAVGVGCNFALACDLIIASEEAIFSQIFARIGLMPDGGGTYFLPRLVGYHKAFELMANAELIDARRALELGLANRVVPFNELDSAVDELALRLARGPAVALARIKAGLNHGLQADLAGALDFEAVNQGECFRSADFREGVTAFREKRRAVFTGK